MKATMAHGRFLMVGRGRMELSRREALVVSGVLVSLTAYLTALFMLI